MSTRDDVESWRLSSLQAAHHYARVAEYQRRLRRLRIQRWVRSSRIAYRLAVIAAGLQIVALAERLWSQ